MKKKISQFFTIGRRFKKEFRRQLRMMIVVTLAFTIAFTWRQTTFDISQNFIKWLTNIQSSSLSSILTSTFITLLSLVLIFIASHFFKENGQDPNY
jgi:hypothetical protein